MSCSRERRVSTAPCWQESRVWFTLPLPVYNPSKSMNQHRGSGGVTEITAAEPFPTRVSSANRAIVSKTEMLVSHSQAPVPSPEQQQPAPGTRRAHQTVPGVQLGPEEPPGHSRGL